jgi:hypothetical protein
MTPLPPDPPPVGPAPPATPGWNPPGPVAPRPPVPRWAPPGPPAPSGPPPPQARGSGGKAALVVVVLAVVSAGAAFVLLGRDDDDAGGSGPGGASPEQVTGSFVEAARTQDCETMVDLVEGVSSRSRRHRRPRRPRRSRWLRQRLRWRSRGWAHEGHVAWSATSFVAVHLCVPAVGAIGLRYPARGSDTVSGRSPGEAERAGGAGSLRRADSRRELHEFVDDERSRFRVVTDDGLGVLVPAPLCPPGAKGPRGATAPGCRGGHDAERLKDLEGENVT